MDGDGARAAGDDGPVAYLDHAATTPLRPEARAAVLEAWDAPPGNPSGAHADARRHRRTVDDARDRLAAALGCGPGEVVLTSGGTEADDLAVHGVLAAAPTASVAVCSATEHHAVLAPVLAAGGATTPVDERGLVDPDLLARVLDDHRGRVALVAVHLVNNETGAVQPVDELAAVVRRHAPGALLHVDAAQALTWLPVDRLAAAADLVAVSAHKFGGPGGVGALVVRDGTRLVPRLLGGGQERGRRSGSTPTALVAGAGVAAELAVAERAVVVARVATLRQRLLAGLSRSLPGTWETGVGVLDPGAVDDPRRRAHKVAGAVPLCLDGVDSEALLFLLDRAGVRASAASSCASGAQQASHVLAAMGVEPGLARGALRLTLGATTTAADVDRVLAVLPDAVARLRREAA